MKVTIKVTKKDIHDLKQARWAEMMVSYYRYTVENRMAIKVARAIKKMEREK